MEFVSLILKLFYSIDIFIWIEIYTVIFIKLEMYYYSNIK